MSAKVSVITPCYNGEPFIDQYISNIVSQTYDHVEVIFVNDGSKDETEQVITMRSKAILDRGYEFKFYSTQNVGVSGAINIGLKGVTGDYIMLLDIDDILYPNAIAKKADYLQQHEECGIVRNNGYYIFEKYPKRKWKFSKPGFNSNHQMVFKKLLLAKAFNWPGSYMIRTSLLMEIYPDMTVYGSRYGQNLQFLLPMSYHYPVGYIDDCLMEYHIYEQSASHDKDQNIIFHLIGEYEDIKLTILNEMSMQEEERLKYTQAVKLYYLRDRMKLLVRMGAIRKFDSVYTILKRTESPSFYDRLLAIGIRIPSFSCIYKCFYYFGMLLRKDVY